jgi:PAS domain S-box-containing protein
MAAEAFLAAIVESSDDAIIAKNLDGIIQSCNPAAERLFGYTADELVGQSVRILIPPERQAEEDDILARLKRGERIDHFETVRLAKDGHEVDISLTVSPVRDAKGAIIGVSKTARDITAHKRAAAALAAQQEWFRVTLASIGDGIIASDAAGHVTYMNAVAETLTGWTNDSAKGLPLADVFHIVNEKTRQRIDNPAALVLRSGNIMGLANHTVLISRDGTERPIADTAAPILDDAGRILGVVLVFRDFSEPRRAEEAIAEQREWLETTLESISDGVIATDVRGRIVFMNPVAEHLTGWRLDTARDRACTEVFNIVNEQTLRVVENPVTRVLQEGVVVGLANHTLLIAADGTERPIDESGAPIRNRDGRIVGVVLVFRDVTERRQAEVERETTARERERLLMAERMARADAERANRLKDDFVAMVSHELRTPLNAILGWTELILKNRHDPALLERGLGIVVRNTRLQTQLISDLLDISRIVSGKLRLDVQSVDLPSLIETAIETVQHAADEKGIAIERRLDTSIGPLAGDAARLQQVVWNLLSNAVKFTPKGGRVRVTLRRQGPMSEIVVEDNGVGIRPDFLPHVFDRFQQADASRTRRVGGLGLGLSIVKNLVEFHGGTVMGASEGEGRGATFTVSLPLAAPPVLSEEALTPASFAGATTSDVSLASIRVLVVLVVTPLSGWTAALRRFRRRRVHARSYSSTRPPNQR